MIYKSPFFFMNKYSILIPIHNELPYIPNLLESLKTYGNSGHEIIVIDDGSDDGSENVLKSCKTIKLITLNTNRGKGVAIRKGLQEAKNNKIIVYDGDMELDPSDIIKLMVLDKENDIRYAMGYRFYALNPIKSNFDWGNFMFTSFFNILFRSNHKDILCCAKAFYIDDIKNYDLISEGFDIDVELSSVITMLSKSSVVPQISIRYSRRSINEGKKLKVYDGWIILYRIIKMLSFI